jgi:lipopolysaccharide transport system ATP-binding protein
MSAPVIKVENLSKQYRIGEREGYKTFREAIVNISKAPFRRWNGANPQSKIGNLESETIWALKDVSFEVKQGQVVGIIGRNGAGKSTLLKILSKITEPTKGRVELMGRVGSLLEVGTGFHPELTGHENIYLYGAILGMDRWEVTRKFGDIVDFAELYKFIETPVKRYSSGMYMRLAFSVAAHLNTEILLVDEVLAVGDVGFQKKCLGKMENVTKHEGRTVIFVSHNLAAITSLCDRVINIKDGKLQNYGEPNLIVEKYINDIVVGKDDFDLSNKKREGNGEINFTEVRVLNIKKQVIKSAYSGQDIIISLKYTSRTKKRLNNISVLVGFRSILGDFLFMCGNEMAGQHFSSISPDGYINCIIKKLPLSSGIYNFNFNCKINGIMADCITDYFQLSVVDGDYYGTGYLPPKSHGGFLVEQGWEVL